MKKFKVEILCLLCRRINTVRLKSGERIVGTNKKWLINARLQLFFAWENSIRISKSGIGAGQNSNVNKKGLAITR